MSAATERELRTQLLDALARRAEAEELLRTCDVNAWRYDLTEWGRRRDTYFAGDPDA